MSMTREQLAEMIDHVTSHLKALNAKKGFDYTQGSDDAFLNFKKCAGRIEKIKDPAFLAWAIYYMKHEDALWTYLEGHELKDKSEPPTARIDDMLLYLLLLRGEIVSRQADRAFIEAHPMVNAVPTVTTATTGVPLKTRAAGEAIPQIACGDCGKVWPHCQCPRRHATHEPMITDPATIHPLEDREG